MITIQRILCPTDLSPESDEALRYAVALATAYKATLFLLHCKERKAYDNGNEATISDDEMKSIFTASLAPHLGLNDFCDLDWQGLIGKNVVDVGNAIVDEAERQKVDLIVMRSRRRSLAAMMLGSTAETVSRTARCPVLVTHPREREWVGFSTGEIDLKRILVAHDFSSDAEVALNYALSLAQEYQTELHLLHVLAKGEKGQPEREWFEQTESAYTNAARRLKSVIPKEAFLWCRIFSAVCWGKAYEEVLTYAKQREIDLICLGASGSDFTISALFGSNVDRILRQAPCPVLVARPVHLSDSGALRVSGDRAENRL